VDPVTVLTLIVAIIIVVSAYLLFNDLPGVLKGDSRRSPRR
jgi:hypothetical protein